MRRDQGDFPTPPALVDAILTTLGAAEGRWARVLEPTCGRGNFLDALLRLRPAPRELVGIEQNPSHAARARELKRVSSASALRIFESSVFEVDLSRDLKWTGGGPLLVVGNPPWVTCSELGALESRNLPPKRNVAGLSGIEALTGASNFDLAESVWLKLLAELADQRPTIAMLCKLSVARRVFLAVHRAGWSVERAELRRIDARAWFRASVSAGLLRLDLGEGPPTETLELFPALDADRPEHSWRVAGNRLVVDLDARDPAATLLGGCALTWRQGLKHDLAGVMELTPQADLDREGYRNGIGESLDIEREFVYPLLKGSDLVKPGPLEARHSVIITQRRLNASTREIERTAPRLWAYLDRHAGRFEARKSSIYRGRDRYAMFGVGDYSFLPYKVAISGLHKVPIFRAVGPLGGRPVMLDDTCYFLGCHSAAEASLIAAILGHPESLRLLRSLTFSDAKRPVTKGVLERLDLVALWRTLDRPSILARAQAEWEQFAPAGPVPEWQDAVETILGSADTRPDPLPCA